MNISADRAWLLVSTQRFDPACLDWACLAVVSSDLSKGEALRADGNLLHGGFGAISSGGAAAGYSRVVYVDAGSVHAQDLWMTLQTASGWSSPVDITAGSPFANNSQPAFSTDGQTLLFDCADQPYAAPGTAICEVGADGKGFRVVFKPEQEPGGSNKNALHHAAYAPDGSIILEADWQGEQVWRLSSGQPPKLVNADLHNDNSPCVLPDGRIVSLWLGRQGGNDNHEIKVMSADGSAYSMPLPGVNVADIGIGCGK